jgi:hypothetical protein
MLDEPVLEELDVLMSETVIIMASPCSAELGVTTIMGSEFANTDNGKHIANRLVIKGFLIVQV